MFFINSIDQLDIVIHLLLYIIRYPKKYPKIDSTPLALRIKSLECTLIIDFEILNPTYTIKSLGQIKTSNFKF